MGLRRHAVLLWNANNRFGWDEIDWRALGYVASTTTVSRYMKQLMLGCGVNPVVIPNGIPESALEPPDAAAAAAIRSAAGTPCLAFKIGRFTSDKGWTQAIDAIAELRAEGLPARVLMRGGIEPYGAEVLGRARHHGLSVCDWFEPVDDAGGVVRALSESRGAAVVNLCRFLPEAVIPEIDLAATAVLANSGHEPFGLVGLEAMAAGGVAVVGATGEEYARPYGNAIVIETDDGAEVAAALRGLVDRPALARRLRREARHDARDFTWPAVIDGLLERLRYMSFHQQVLTASPGTRLRS
jgi:glycosyltransferase involved in cell wall biosynthesis